LFLELCPAFRTLRVDLGPLLDALAVEEVLAGGVDGLTALLLPHQTDGTDLLPIHVFLDILKFIELGCPGGTRFDGVVVVEGLEEGHLAQILLSLADESELDLEASEGQQVVLSCNIIMQKLDEEEQGGDEVHCEDETCVERQLQHLAVKAVEGVVGRLGPEQKGKHNVADLNDSHKPNGPLNPGVILDHINAGYDQTEEVLQTLAEIEDAVVEKEGHAAGLRDEDPAQHEAGQGESEVEQQEYFVRECYPALP